MNIKMNGMILENVSLAEAMTIIGKKNVKVSEPVIKRKKGERVFWTEEEILRLVGLIKENVYPSVVKNDTLLRARHSKGAIQTQYSVIKTKNLNSSRMSKKNIALVKRLLNIN